MDKYDIDNYFLLRYERMSRKEVREGWFLALFPTVVNLIYIWGATNRLSLFLLSFFLAISVWAVFLLRKRGGPVLMRFLFVGTSIFTWDMMFLTVLIVYVMFSYHGSTPWFLFIVLLAVISAAISVLLVRRRIISACGNKDNARSPNMKGYYIAGSFASAAALGAAFARTVLANASEDAIKYIFLVGLLLAVVVLSIGVSIYFYNAYLIIRYCTHKFLR